MKAAVMMVCAVLLASVAVVGIKHVGDARIEAHLIGAAAAQER